MQGYMLALELDQSYWGTPEQNITEIQE
jgi:hypothetical protein